MDEAPARRGPRGAGRARGSGPRFIAKAFAAGADAVMIGSLFAGSDETPGKLIRRNGKLFKSFRGMGSVGAMNKGSADRYFQSKQKDTSKYVPEGVEGFAKYKGKVGNIIYKLIDFKILNFLENLVYFCL